MGEKLIKEYLKDILIYVGEIEQIHLDAKNIDGFKNNFYYKRTAERNFLIIGEVVKKPSTPSLKIVMNLRNRESNFGLRNFLAHG